MRTKPSELDVVSSPDHSCQLGSAEGNEAIEWDYDGETQRMQIAKRKSRVQEDLARLYLRLNGFFVTGLIVHSPVQNRVLTEVDALAVRMPHNAEPDRGVGPHDLLDLSSEHTDLVICEVKSRRSQLCFNQALTEDPDAATKVLRWSGLFREEEVRDLSMILQSLLAARPLRSNAPPTITGPRGTRVRCLLFSLERDTRRPNQAWFITGTEVFDYVHRCLSPSKSPSSCSRSYDFGLWGDRERIVRYFKEGKGQSPGNMNQLYGALGLCR